MHGETVATFGMFSTPDLDELFSSSDSAAYYFGEFRANHVSGNLIAVAGGLAVGALVLWPERDDRGAQIALISASAAGIFVSIIGDRRADRARNSLTRAVWWYNYDLER